MRVGEVGVVIKVTQMRILGFVKWRPPLDPDAPWMELDLRDSTSDSGLDLCHS